MRRLGETATIRLLTRHHPERTALLKDAEKEIRGFDEIAPIKTLTKIPRARVGG
jgi:hypothetical protein